MVPPAISPQQPPMMWIGLKESKCPKVTQPHTIPKIKFEFTVPSFKSSTLLY